jgi:UDP-glucose 4-epimerase
MKVLLTGAFGNIGEKTLKELLKQGHQVRCFDVSTKANQRRARKYRRQTEIVWGDLRRTDQVAAAVADQDAVLHLAYVIPNLSATGIASEDRPEWAREINVGGTRNLIEAMQRLSKPPKLIFTSSLHVYGKTQDNPPPRTVADPVQPVEHYAHHKVESEALVRASTLTWSIYRLGAALPVQLILDPGMFDIPLKNRIEFVHAKDVALALVHGLESPEIWGQTWHVGGGPQCQYKYQEIVDRILGTVGIGSLPDEAFGDQPYSTDWLETSESQRILRFQTRTLDDYIQELKQALSFRRYLVLVFRPFVRAWLLGKSVAYQTWKATQKRKLQSGGLAS